MTHANPIWKHSFKVKQEHNKDGSWKCTNMSQTCLKEITCYIVKTFLASIRPNKSPQLIGYM